MRLTLALAAIALLAACGHKDDSVGGVSPEEDRMLNEAAASQDAPQPANDNTTVLAVPAANAASANTVQPTLQGNAQ